MTKETKPKYPELVHKENWTPVMTYIHQRAMKLGLMLGLIEGILFMAVLWMILEKFYV